MKKTLSMLALLLVSMQFLSNNVPDSLENELPRLHGKDRYNALYTLVRKYSQTDVKKSIDYAIEYYEMADSLDSDTNRITALNALAISHFYAGENFKALKFLIEMTVAINDQLVKDPESRYFKDMLATAYNNQASILDNIGEREQSIDMLFKAEKVIDEMLADDPENKDLTEFRISVFNNIGLRFYHREELVKSLDFIESALELSEKYQLNDRISLTLNNLGLVYIKLNRLEDAQKSFERALYLNRQDGDSLGIAGNLLNIGWVYENWEKYDSALYFYNKSLELSRYIYYPFGTMTSLKSLGAVMIELRVWTAAEEYLEEALDIAIKTNNLEIQEQVFDEYYDCCQKKGDYKKALYYLEKQQWAKDSLFNIQNTNQLAYWQTRYDTEKVEKENLELNNENKIKQLKIDRKNSQLMWLIIGSVLLIVLLVIISVLFRQRNIAYLNIVKRNQEIVAFERKFHTGEQGWDILEDTKSAETDLLLEQLEKYMEEEQPYLLHHLNLNNICKKLNTNRTYLSRLINDSYHQNFNAWINEHRVREARRMLFDNRYDHFTVEGVGELAGFSSKASFHANFKKLIGVTPMYFRENRV